MTNPKRKRNITSEADLTDLDVSIIFNKMSSALGNEPQHPETFDASPLRALLREVIDLHNSNAR